MTTGLLEIAPPLYPVPPPEYGGIERDIAELAKGLINTYGNAYEIFLLARGDSRPNAPNITVYSILSAQEAERIMSDDEAMNPQRERLLQQAEDEALRHTAQLLTQGKIHIINLRWERPRLANELSRLAAMHAVPLLISFSCHPNDNIGAILDHPRPGVTYTAHTQAHRRSLLGIRKRPEIRIVPNGVDMTAMLPTTKTLRITKETPKLPMLQKLKQTARDYLLHLGSITPVKGQLSSIQIARRAGMPLILAGGPDTSNPVSVNYFREVAAQVDNHHLYYFGSANDDERNELMRYAYATLFCSGLEKEYTEAFGRVIAESAAVGTPIVGCGTGAFPELMAHFPGVMGLVFDTYGERDGGRKRSIREAATLVGHVPLLNRLDCARAARETMSVERTIKATHQLIQELVASNRRAIV